MNNKVNRFIRTLKKKDLTLALAESVTGGLAANLLCTGIGTSDVFKGCIVCYDAEVKVKLLKVPQSLLDKFTAESQEVTDSLSRKIKPLIKADVHAALTGLASPGGSEGPGKPVGTVFMSVLFRNRIYRMRKVFRGSPLEIRTKAAYALLGFITQKVVHER
jgi:nicotinamide-nucleotide amidase